MGAASNSAFRSFRSSSLALLMMIGAIKPANGHLVAGRGTHWSNPLAATVNPRTGGTQIRHFVMAITSVRFRSRRATGTVPRPDASFCRIGPRRANRKPAGSLNGPRPGLGLALRVLSYANEGFAARGANLQEISKEIQARLQDCHTAAG
jgi:hypothetical protein